MSLMLVEGLPSREFTVGENPSYATNWTVMGTEDRTVAEGVATAATPATVSTSNGTLFRQAVSGRETAPETWSVDVRYGPLKPPQPGDWSFQFDFTGGKEKITQARQHVQSYGRPNETPPDHHGAIGVKEDGTVEGCEIVVPQATFSETWQFAAASITGDYKQAIYNLVGTMNQSSFRGCAARRVLFTGASGSRAARNPDVFEVHFKFSVGRHRTNVTIGAITGIAKEAWDYLWVEYEHAIHDAARRPVRRPVAVHVERVYEEGDFSILGIGA